MITPTFLHALELLCHTDLIGTFPTGVLDAAVAAAATLVSSEPPIAIEAVSLHLVRHRRSDLDAVVSLVAGLIGATLQKRRPVEDDPA